MTYDLTIGEYYEEEPDEEGYIYKGVKWLELQEAPALPGAEVSRHTNHISIPWFGGYSELENLVSVFDSDLAHTLFTGSNDSINIPLTPCLVAKIRLVVKQYREDFPEAVAGFLDGMDYGLARLVILEWWANYSLRTYGANAVIHIS